MAFWQPKTLKVALIPSSMLHGVLGVIAVDHTAKYYQKVLNYLYSTACVVGYVILFATYRTTPTLEWIDASRSKSLIITSFYHVANYLGLITVIGPLVASFFHNKRYNKLRHELSDIDEITKQLGILDRYESVLKRQLCHFFVLLVLILAFFACAYFTITRDTRNELTDYTGYLIYFYGPWLWLIANDAVIYNYSRELRRSFEHLNKLLMSLRSTNFRESLGGSNTIVEDGRMFGTSEERSKRSRDNGEQESVKKMNAPRSTALIEPSFASNGVVEVNRVFGRSERLERLHVIRKLYIRLGYATKDWNDINGVGIYCSVILSPGFCLITMYKMYLLIASPETEVLTNHGNEVYLPLMCCLYIAAMIFSMVHCAATLTAEARRTGVILLEYLHPVADIRSEVHEFSLQIIQNPVQLSVSGFCPFDFSLIRRIVTMVGTNFFILVQMNGQHETPRSTNVPSN